ncbi:MAG: hypothetical protein UT30_C0045G0003 [Candidatus Uhrbacteria bacterium GW2011_GWF2_39_13]|uniref:Uncharacterized protein n=1 Tax=Candidatus Uhrbacteria bacterium GW2011_GWF2_39_13 TaxID=1618995 RepID=A0A0G0MR24_9BACT|nr:MAG: hypothetical protein UT30_C0045G0003 [Candidatus Uhrbacteria bacterium GW2011_GWF2_39_13]
MLIDWKNRISWEGLITSALSKNIGNDYAQIIRDNAENIQYRDDDEGTCNLFAGKRSRSDIIDSVSKELKKFVTNIQAYHACRTENVETYYKNGLLPLNPENIQDLFHKIFCEPEGLFSLEEIKCAISVVSIKTRENVTHVALDDRFLIRRCGHYLIYGSEYLNCLSVHLPRGGEHTRDILKNFGNATIFSCQVPFSWIETDELFELASCMIAEHAYSLAHNKTDVSNLDFAITVQGKIPPERICSHYHPEQIRDPYKQCRIWNDKKQSYET